jgi:hypothetical protein
VPVELVSLLISEPVAITNDDKSILLRRQEFGRERYPLLRVLLEERLARLLSVSLL